NAADGSAGAFTINVVLSQDGIYDSGDYELATVNVDGIGPWGESINDVMVTLPEAETYPDGTYNIIMFVDSNNTVEEFDENNNIGVCPINIVTTANVIEGVDLIPVEFGVDMEGMTDPFQWSGSYTGFADVYNIGNTDAGAFTIKIALSMDMNFDSADTVLGTAQVESLPAGQFSENDIIITLPTEGFMDGEYFLVMSVDSDNAVTEIDEANNFDDMNIFIGEGWTEPGPGMDGIDLAIPFVDVPWQVSEGQEIQVGFEVENWGNVDAEAFTVSFFLSQDPAIEVDASGVIGENEIALGEVTLAGLIAGSFAEDVTTLTLPSELGHDSYYLVAIANFDKSIEENFHDNNHNMAFMNVMGSGTDLAILDMFMPYDAQWGQVINVDARVENRSAQTVDSVDVAFYLSEDWEFDGSDTLLTTVNLIDVFGGTEATATAEITLPNDRDGEAFMKVIAKVDPDEVIDEIDEFNNIWVRDLYIGTPELANLMVWPMIMFDPAQGGVDWGQDLTVDTVIHNGSNATTQGAFTVTYYLSLDDSPDDGDTVLHNEEITNSIMPFEHYFRTVTLNMPAENPAGIEQNEWFILAEVDSANTIVEFDEMDNVGWSNIFIGSQPADLTGWFDIDVEGNVIWGEQVSTTGNIENMGGSDVGEFEVAYYLTSDPEIDESDYLLTTQTISSLAAQAVTPVLSSVTLPDNSSGQFDSGTFFIVGVIDSANSVAEFDEYNNFMGDWLTTDVAAAELVAFHLEPYVDGGEPAPEPGIEPYPMPNQGGPLLWNQPINVNYGLGNMGNLDAENFQVNFYLAGYDAIVE
ncbi:MAG: hypothetical protein KAT56_07060, partial [Sedimentisphaerales bacterium]|nr:hypothetical protein [Sedimentisphaerales bacterium]